MQVSFAGKLGPVDDIMAPSDNTCVEKLIIQVKC